MDRSLQDEAAAFTAISIGGTLVSGEPEPGTYLAELRAMIRRRDEEGWSEEAFDSAMRDLRQRA